MSGEHRNPGGRLRARFALTHVQERADEQLRARWQRRLDSGEEVWCWRCRLQGVLTRVDPHRWHLSEAGRSPDCVDCHAAAGPGGSDNLRGAGVRRATRAGSGSTR